MTREQRESGAAGVDRRMALAGIGGAGSLLALPGAAATTAGGAPASRFGGWSTDDHGLPRYVFAGDLPVATTTPAGHSYPLEPDPVFLLGNADLTLFAYASGRLLFVSGERGWVRLNEAARTAPGHTATLTVTGGGTTRTHDLIGLAGTAASARRATRSFGCGTARWRLEPEPGLVVERIVSIAPTVGAARAQPAAVVTIRLSNTGPLPLDLDHVESVLANPTLLPVDQPHPIRFVNTARPLPGGHGILCDATAVSDVPGVLTTIDAPNRYNLFPPALVLATPEIAAAATVKFAQYGIEGGAVALCARSRLRLAPGATRDIVLVIALKSPEADLAPLQQFIAVLGPSPTGDWFRQEWADVLAPLASVPDPALRAELLWDGHALLAMATYAAYFGQTFIPQGMTYDYVLGVNAGPRDHLQHAMGAACFAPELARSALLYTLCAMTEAGTIKFTVSGNGETASSTWSPSDQSLALFYAVDEYLRITRDMAFLEVETPYLPAADRSPGMPGTVLDKLSRAFVHLRDHVGTGPHGLVRLLTGDWNDQIYLGVPDGLYRDTAESQMNSAMAMAVIPPLADRLNAYAGTCRAADAAAIGLARDMRAYADRITQAMLRDMEGRTFARRAWLAPGKPLGDDDMYLEAQSFLFQAAAFPVARKRVLLREMRRRLIDGEALGPRQQERPPANPRMTSGTSENGGFWYAPTGMAIAGIASFDRPAALALLDRMTFRYVARHYPTYWVGQWTAPDTINAATSGDIAGLPRPMDDGLWRRMANWCAHPHAWPIYCYFRIRDAARADG